MARVMGRVRVRQRPGDEDTADDETVQNLGVVTPLAETGFGPNLQLPHARGDGIPRAIRSAA